VRLTPLAIPLAVLASLAAASPAAAAEHTVNALDYEFQARDLQVAVGDTVNWNFVNGGHTATSARGQAERWDSGSAAAGELFAHTFDNPGRYQYICVPHEAFDMKGVITVGTDEVARSVSRFKAKRTGKRVKVSFRLNEAATVTYRLRGATRRTVKRGRLAAGKRSFTVRRLKVGRHRGTLTVVDDFDRKQTAKSTFRVR
jgi:plastocyanin